MGEVSGVSKSPPVLFNGGAPAEGELFDGRPAEGELPGVSKAPSEAELSGVAGGSHSISLSVILLYSIGALFLGAATIRVMYAIVMGHTSCTYIAVFI